MNNWGPQTWKLMENQTVLFAEIYKDEFNTDKIKNVLKNYKKSAETVIITTRMDKRDNVEEYGFFGKQENGFVLNSIDDENFEELEDHFFEYSPKYNIYFYQAFDSKSNMVWFHIFWLD